VAALASLLLVSCVANGDAPEQDKARPPALVDPALAADGRRIAVRECSSCHAIDDQRVSPRPEAPPMLALLWGYDPDMLAEDLIEGIRVGHDDMPHFDFDVRAADALVAYLKSIERPEAQLDR
jgi:mono/diheme cytochrome c family protein